jgi:hypothetical protein
MLYFCSNFFYSICFKSTKKLFKMATFTFCLGDHIFFICYLKNHPTFFWDFRSKLLGNILKIFLISCSIFQTNFSWILSWKYLKWLLSLCLNMSSFCSFALVYTLNYNFSDELRFGRNPLKLYPELKKIISPKCDKLVSQPVYRLKKNSWTKLFLSMC